MSTTRKIAHNTIIQIVGKAVSTFFGLFAIGMMTRYLGSEKFGWYVTVISFLQFIGILIDFGLIPVTAQMMSEPNFDKKQLFRNLLGFRFTTAIIFLAIAPFIALFFPYPDEVKIAITFSTISFLSICMNQILNGYYQATLKMHIQVIGEVTGRIVLVLGLLLLIMQKASFLSVMWLIVLSSVSYTIVLWLSARKSTPAGFGFDWDIWKAIAKKMWPIAISIMFNVIYLKGDIVILSIFKSQTEVGIYGAAYRVIDILAQLAMMIMGVMLPLLAYAWSRNLKHDFRLRYQQSFDAIMLFAVPMAVGTLLLGDKIMLLVAGPKFIESGVVLKVLAFAVFWVYLGAVFGHTAVAINRQKQTIWIFLSDAVLTLIGYFIFIPLYGMHGAAWMTVFSELYAGILLFLTVRHYAQEKLRMKTLSKIIIASVIMGSLLVLFSTLHIIVLVIIGVVSYGVVLLAIGGISKETLKEISYLK